MFKELNKSAAECRYDKCQGPQVFVLCVSRSTGLDRTGNLWKPNITIQISIQIVEVFYLDTFFEKLKDVESLFFLSYQISIQNISFFFFVVDFQILCFYRNCVHHINFSKQIERYLERQNRYRIDLHVYISRYFSRQIYIYIDYLDFEILVYLDRYIKIQKTWMESLAIGLAK